MPIDQALPDEQPYGLADWTDFEDNWREKDAEWLQSLGVPRFSTTADRDAKLTAPAVGRLIYNGQTGYLQLKGPSAWADYKPLPVYLAAQTDTAAQVLLVHTGAAGKGISFTPGNVHVNHDLLVLNTVLSVNATGMSLKTGTKTARLTTDATSLVSDSPISAPSITLTGTGTVLTATGKTLAVGTLTADTATIANMTLSGTLTGGVVNGTSGTVGGIALGTAGVGGINIANASDGFQSQTGMYYGDGTGAFVRQRAANKGALGTAYVKVTSTVIDHVGGTTEFNNQTAFKGGRSVQWYNAAGTHVAYLGPTIYSPTDPGVGNFPDGTIWIS